ncbi:MAG: nuclear transport factor 2 family protein [Leptolyngbyaceae cyanobacterium SU_3_3]|nr:nuclear transport factor 2 family protein [Leptolyngbyaceae cyanobacterium SU_3_3]
MGAPSPKLVDLWLAKAFNTQDIEAAAAMYHPEASVVCLEQVHGSDIVARGADAIRETMAGYIELKPHMDVVVHHTTVSGDLRCAGRSGGSRVAMKMASRSKSITTAWR